MVKNGLSTLNATLNGLEPAEWRDEDWNLQTHSVSKMLAILVGSFPTSNLPDAAVFTRVMLDDVMALDPSFLDLEGACRRLRQTSKFMPSISELIAAIKAEMRAWCRRYDAIEMVADSHAELTKLLADERTRREALVAPFREGDTVSHNRFGRGRVVCQTDIGLEVEFEAGPRRMMVPGFLTKVGHE